MSLPAKYSRVAMFLHWLISLAIIANVALGLAIERVPEEKIRFVIDTHKSIGITVLGLALMRLLWRATHPPPPLPAHYPAWERYSAHLVHALLYLLIFALPISGWLHDSAWKAAPEVKMYWFGLFEWPRIPWIMQMEPERKEILHGVFNWVHNSFAYLLYALFALHVGGALKHQLIDREPEIQRMLP